jgi:hypothetical protein
MTDLFEKELKVINIGLKSFKQTLDIYNVPSVQVDWHRPIVVENNALKRIRLNREYVAMANIEAVHRIVNSRPLLVGLDMAINVIPGMHKNLLLHAGPPIKWGDMCGPMRGAVIGALIYEGKAKSYDEAVLLAGSGEIEFAPCHEHDSVGPMAGIISPSMPVFIIKNDTYGSFSFATLNEGLGKVLRYGAFSDEVIIRLKWMEDILYPALRKAIEKTGPIDLQIIIAQALQMGDELHNRNRAATSILYRILAPAIARTSPEAEIAAKVLEFIDSNDHFFLNLSMAAAKACLDSARGIEYGSIVTGMARNGVEFGIQLAGTGEQWFCGPAPVPDALFFAGFTKDDANPDIGDSAIAETYGLGGFAIAAAPAIVGFVGGNVQDAVNYTTQMYEIATSENGSFQIPYLNFRGVPIGIDVIKVIEKNILPFIDTGVAHKNAGIGQIGAGVLRAPEEPFKRAFEGLAKSITKKQEHI